MKVKGPDLGWWEAYLRSDNARGWLRVVAALDALANDPEVQKSPGASGFTAVMLEIAGDSISSTNAAEALVPLGNALPNGALGVKFRDGRKPQAEGPVKKAVRRLVEKNPNATARELWATLLRKAPRGIEAFDSRGRQWLEWKSSTNRLHSVEFPAFQNIVSAVKRARKIIE